MAQNTVKGVPDFDLREAEEIERLLKEEEQKAREEASRIHPLKKLLSHKLVWILTGTFLLAGIVSWGILTVMDHSSDVSGLSPRQSVSPQDSIPAIVQIQKPNIHPLKPFFVPISSKEKSKEKFLQVTAHLVLSNRRLHKDIDKVEPLIRQSIYSALRRKKWRDFRKGGVEIEEKIKREILTASNSYLLSGTGTITNIIFTEFIINPS